METLKAINLTKRFNLSKKQQKDKKTTNKSFMAVDHINLRLHEGEIYGLLGPNGAGKTTTLRMLATLFTPSEGDIYVKDLKLSENLDEARKHIGFLTSELKLDPFFTPDYLFDFFAELYDLSEEVKNQRKEQLFNSFEISTYRHKKIGELSTGMKQKVSLAISLIHDPEIIIFDEPTNGLDILAAKVVEDYLKNLKSQNKTIIVSTHIFSLVEELCDRVGIIIDGKLVYENNLEEINKKSNLQDTFFALYKESRGDK